MMTDDMINDFTLLNKYQALLIENDKLKAVNKKFKEQLGILNISKVRLDKIKSPSNIIEEEDYSNTTIQLENIFSFHQKSKSEEKIWLFMSHFK